MGVGLTSQGKSELQKLAGQRARGQRPRFWSQLPASVVLTVQQRAGASPPEARAAKALSLLSTQSRLPLRRPLASLQPGQPLSPFECTGSHLISCPTGVFVIEL